jgi:hypothetical protein
MMLLSTIDYLIFLFFLFEMALRLVSFTDKRDAFRRDDFVFDFSITALMTVDAWIIPAFFRMLSLSGTSAGSSSSFRVLRMFRLWRLARLGRLLRSYPTIIVLLHGMVRALRAVVSTCCLLFVVIYIFAVIFTHLLADVDESQHDFSTVPSSMVCLLARGIFADQSSLIYEMLDIHFFYFVLVMVYIILANLTLMNMLLGIVCQVVTRVAEAQSDASSIVEMRSKLKSTMEQMGLDQNACLGMDEFRKLFEEPAMVHALSEIGIDVIALVECAELLFDNEDTEITYQEFVLDLVKFRGTLPCTVKDVMDIRMHLMSECRKLEHQLRQQSLPPNSLSRCR